MTTPASDKPATATAEAHRSARAPPALVDAVFRARELSIAGALLLLIARHPDRQPGLPLRPGHQGPAAERLDPGAARRRPVGGRHHPQHRPVGRLGRRHHRLRLRQVRPGHATTVSSPSSLLGTASASSADCVNGPLVSFGQGPGARRHPRHALHHPGRRLTGRRTAQITAADLPDGSCDLGSGSLLGVPYLPLIAAAVLLAVTAYYLRTTAAAASCTRSAPTPRPPGSPASRSASRILAAYAFSGAVAGLAGAL